MHNISKSIFLNALHCPTLGWYSRKETISILSPFVALQLEQGIEVGLKARELFSKGILVDELSMTTAVETTAQLMADPEISVIFEGAFSVDEYVTFVLNEVLKEEEEETEAAFSKEEEEEVKKRLRALGYLD